MNMQMIAASLPNHISVNRSIDPSASAQIMSFSKDYLPHSMQRLSHFCYPTNYLRSVVSSTCRKVRDSRRFPIQNKYALSTGDINARRRSKTCLWLFISMSWIILATAV